MALTGARCSQETVSTTLANVADTARQAGTNEAQEQAATQGETLVNSAKEAAGNAKSEAQNAGAALTNAAQDAAASIPGDAINKVTPAVLDPISEDGAYTNYSEDTLSDAQKKGKTVLFFHASWCPFCQEADADLKANTAKLENDITVLKVDYDTQTALKKKYGVTYQHTFVHIDQEGNKVAVWSGGGVDEINARVK